MTRRVAVVCALLLSSSLVRADSSQGSDPIAHSHFKAGQSMFEVGRYLDAVREFDAGYTRSKKPIFLLNIAQCYRIAGYTGAARDYYMRYLDETPDDANGARSQAQDIVAELDRTIAVEGAGPTPPPIIPPPKIVTSVIVRDAPKPKRWPLWLGIGVGSALVVGGVVAGVVIGTRQGTTQLPVDSAR